MARSRRGRCHRQRRLRKWCFADFKKLPRSAYKNWLRFVCQGFPGLLQKDYEKDELRMTVDEVAKSKDDRFAGYKSICLFGLGSLFWGSATGFLGQLKEKAKRDGMKPPTWINICYVYSAFALLFMLLGVAASTFPKSSWFAPSLAGFDSLQALLLILGGFHVASLKYHQYDTECKYSLIGSSILITIYWGLSVQDPMMLHFLVKLVFWLTSLVVYLLGMGIYKIWQFCKFVKTKVIALKNNLMAGNNAPGNYFLLPQTNPPAEGGSPASPDESTSL